MDDVFDVNSYFLDELKDAAAAGDEHRLQHLGAPANLVNRIGMMSSEERVALASIPTALCGFGGYQPSEVALGNDRLREFRFALISAQRYAAGLGDPELQMRFGLSGEDVRFLGHTTTRGMRAMAWSSHPRIEVRMTRALASVLDSSLGGEVRASAVASNRMFHMVRTMAASLK